MPLRARRAERARHAPSALNFTFKVFFYLSLPVVKEQPAASCAAGVEIVSGMVGAPGLEPGTSSLSEKRSNQLSYAPAGTLVEPKGLEPTTSCLQSRRSTS